jgi:oligoribonuclease
MTEPQLNGARTYLWFDTEFSTLELEDARLLQAALVPTDTQFRRVLPASEDRRWIVQLPAGATCSPWVEEHLPDLVRRCRSAEAVPVERVNEDLNRLLGDWFGEPADEIEKRPVLAGNSLHADWMLSRRYLPALLKHCHYRHLDVSAFKVHWQRTGRPKFDKDHPAEIRRWFPGEFNSGASEHDAHYDCLASISEMNRYWSDLSAP